jgi:hypothetical protein
VIKVSIEKLSGSTPVLNMLANIDLATPEYTVLVWDIIKCQERNTVITRQAVNSRSVIVTTWRSTRIGLSLYFTLYTSDADMLLNKQQAIGKHLSIIARNDGDEQKLSRKWQNLADKFNWISCYFAGAGR